MDTDPNADLTDPIYTPLSIKRLSKERSPYQ